MTFREVLYTSAGLVGTVPDNIRALRRRFDVGVCGGLYTRAVGWAARRSIPKPARRPMLSVFARLVGAQTDEAELSLDEYTSFGSFFARRLREGMRPVDRAHNSVVSPCDGLVVSAGPIRKDQALQAKGHGYSITELLASEELAAKFEGGHYLTVYLSPRDYHRVHAPVGGALASCRYVPGRLWPVSPMFRTRVTGLYSRNERMIVELATQWGAVVVVLVGAAGVGNVSVCHAGVEARRLRSNGPGPIPIELQGDTNVQKGDELAAFRLGSTVVCLFPNSLFRLDHIEPNAVVRCGQAVGVTLSAASTRTA